MKLIDIPFSLSKEYPNRHSPRSFVPRVWRHQQVSQGTEGEKFSKYMETIGYNPRELNGYSV